MSESHIVAHRGLWSRLSDQNTASALRNAVSAGFGIETDLRHSDGALVLQHDLNDPAMPFDAIASALAQHPAPIALNVKEDGLAPLLSTLAPMSTNSFFFDMSWPETLHYAREGLPIALRVSEWEIIDMTLFDRLGVPIRLILDNFESDWWLEDATVHNAVLAGQTMLISPEIHGRDPRAAWHWAAILIRDGAHLSICTDLCHQALEALN